MARLDGLDFVNQAMLFGAGLLVTLLPFLVLLGAFASESVDDDIALHLGLDHRAAKIVSHLFNQAPARMNSAMVLSFVIMLAGTLTVAASLQQIYERVFDPPVARGHGVCVTRPDTATPRRRQPAAARRARALESRGTQVA